MASPGTHQTMLRGGYDAFLTKFNIMNHQVMWSTYYGGDGYDVAHSVKVAEDGHVYIAGITTSREHIATRGAHQENLAGGTDVFVAKFNSFTGQLVAATYLGGEKNEGNMNHVALALSRNGYIYILSDTLSSTGIATADAPYKARGGQADLDLLDLFLVKLKQSDLQRVWGTYLGYRNVEGQGVMTLGADDNSLYIAVASSGGEETSEDTFQTTTGYGLLGKYQAMDGRMQWLTFFDAPIRGIGVNAANQVAIAGAHNTTVTRSELPLNVVSENAHQKDMSGNMDAFVAKFSDQAPPPRVVAPDQVIGYAGQPIDLVRFKNNSGRATRWNAVGLPEGLVMNINQGTVTGTPVRAGVYNVLITAENDRGTSRLTSIFKIYSRPELRGPDGVVLKVGQAMSPVLATNVGGQADEWILRDKPAWMEFDSRIGQISGLPTETGIFTVYLMARNPAGESTQKIDFIVESAMPLITSSLVATGVQGNPFTYLIQSENATSVEVRGLPSNLSVNLSTRTISGIPMTAGNYDVTIIASNQSTSTEAILKLTILPQPPEITSPAVWSVKQGEPVSFQITTIPQADQFTAQGLPPGLSLNESTGIIQGIVQNVGSYPVNITSKNQGGQGHQVLTIQVTSSKSAMIVPPTINAPDSIKGILGSAFGFAINATGDVTRYDAIGLPPGLSVSPNTGYIVGTPEQTGTFDVRLIAMNAAGTATKSLIITISNQNIAIFSTPASANIAPGNFSIPTPFNNPMQLPSAAQAQLNVTPTPPLPQASAANYTSQQKGPETKTETKKSTAEEKTKDPRQSDQKKDGTKDNAKKENDKDVLGPPTIVSSSNVVGVVGQNLTYAIHTQHPAISFNIQEQLPQGLLLDERAGIIRGTPTDPGTSIVTVSAFNAKGNSSKAITFNIAKPPVPVITSETFIRGYINKPFEYQIRASGNPSQLEINGALPDGLVFESKTGRITGTPEKEMRNEVKMIAINAGGRAEKNLIIQISKAPPPEISTIASLISEVGKPFEQKIESDQEIKTFLIEGNLPEGIEFDKNKGILSGTPKKEGQYAFEIKAVNESGTGAKKFTLRVVPPKKPIITTSRTARGIIDRPFRYQIRSNIGAEKYVITGDLPEGLNFDSKIGLIEGRPQALGNFTLKIQAIKGDEIAEGTLTLIIEDANIRPIRLRPSPDNLNELISDEKPSIAAYQP
jgi:hypothetical protein